MSAQDFAPLMLDRPSHRPEGRGSREFASPGERLVVFERGAYHLYPCHEVGRIYATDQHSAFVWRGRELWTHESLDALATRLAPLGFLRVHRRELVALSHVRCLRRHGRGAWLELADGQRAMVARRRVAVVLAGLGLGPPRQDVRLGPPRGDAPCTAVVGSTSLQ